MWLKLLAAIEFVTSLIFRILYPFQEHATSKHWKCIIIKKKKYHAGVLLYEKFENYDAIIINYYSI